MAFVISKKSKLWGQERRLYYLVESYRDGNKIKRRALLSLKAHKTVADLLTFTEQKQIRLTDHLHKNIERLDYFRKTGKISSPFPPTRHTGRMLIKHVEKRKTELEQCQKEIERIKSFL